MLLHHLKLRPKGKKMESCLFKRKEEEEEHYESFKIITSSQNWFIFIL